jgi:hypothetical protein
MHAMCCFAGRVSDVTGTSIFARVRGDREYLAYEMTFTSDEQTAMILPIPVASGVGREPVEFIALDDYSRFFRDLETHFSHSRFTTLGRITTRNFAPLKVQLVGAFEASFVPRMSDFDRLDDRFRIPHDVWKLLPEYDSFGFVVFKLRPGRHAKVHPMAFSFETRDPANVFFPTVHVHDGTFHDEADFDHVLYTQNKPASLVSRVDLPWF